MPDMNENAETQQEYFGKAKLETDYKDLSMRLYKRIADLEKENEELKEKLNFCTQYYQGEKAKEQLTKAKEIIREFMKYEINEYDGSLEIHFEELKKQAEQFLNSEVKK